MVMMMMRLRWGFHFHIRRERKIQPVIIVIITVVVVVVVATIITHGFHGLSHSQGLSFSLLPPYSDQRLLVSFSCGKATQSLGRI